MAVKPTAAIIQLYGLWELKGVKSSSIKVMRSSVPMRPLRKETFLPMRIWLVCTAPTTRMASKTLDGSFSSLFRSKSSLIVTMRRRRT